MGGGGANVANLVSGCVPPALKKAILSFRIAERHSLNMIQDHLDFTKLNWIVGDLHDLAMAILAAKKIML